MCGLNGIFSSEIVRDLGERIQKMNKAISHRGPDSEGKLCFNSNVGLGHRRLSILDLDSRAGQPMKSLSERYSIVFNGEIVNFEEIKAELVYPFQTTSDTEVILASIEINSLEWFLERANGMFAIAIYDKKSDDITLVRDRFGIKPLFYTVVNGCLVFSSEIKGILSSGLVDAVFREESVDEYLGNRFVREPFTFFENIYQVKSSHYTVVTKDLKFDEKKYWELPKLNFEKEFDESEILQKTEKEVVGAIKRWLISDVKVGAYLSGGVDSSLTTAVIAQNAEKGVDTYTIGFEEKGFNEFEFAKKVADKYNTNHREFLLSQESYMEEWDRLLWFKDAPLGVPNEIPLAIMSTNLSSDITVVISGEGADELFGGYGKIFRLAFDYSNKDDNRKDFYSDFISSYEYVPREIRDKFLTIKHDRGYFDEKIQKEFMGYPNEENIFRFFHQYHIKGLLQRVDMTTMQTSVEARPPFLDHKLVEYVYREVPYDLKLKWVSDSAKIEAKGMLAKDYSEKLDVPKFALKEISRNYIPKEIIDRKKMGFPVPLTSWFPDLEKLSKKYLVDASWLNQKEIDGLMNVLNENERAGQLLWMFINVEMFRKKYFEKVWTW